MFERFQSFKSIEAHVTLKPVTCIIKYVFRIVNLFNVLFECLGSREMLLTSTADVGLTSQLFKLRDQKFLFVIDFEVSLQYVQIGKLFLTFRTRMEHVYVHFSLMLQVQFLRLKSLKTNGTLEPFVAKLLWIRYSMLLVVQFGMFRHLLLGNEWLFAITASFWLGI